MTSAVTGKGKDLCVTCKHERRFHIAAGTRAIPFDVCIVCPELAHLHEFEETVAVHGK